MNLKKFATRSQQAGDSEEAELLMESLSEPGFKILKEDDEDGNGDPNPSTEELEPRSILGIKNPWNYLFVSPRF